MNNWLARSIFMTSHKISVLNVNPEDACLLLEILKIRLSVEAVRKVRFYTNTQKCEAVNRSLSVSLPKNINFSRNVFGRTASTIHRINNGTGKSVILKCKNLGVDLSTRSKMCMESMDRDEHNSKIYATCPANAKHRLESSARKIREHLNYKAKHPNDLDYKKGHFDHTYSNG